MTTTRDISHYIREANSFSTFGKLKVRDEGNDVANIKACINSFKTAIKPLFIQYPEVDCFILASTKDDSMSITLFKDKLIFDKWNEAGVLKQWVLDFRSNTLKSEAIVITNLKTLERLFSYLNYLYRELANDRAVLYEATIEKNDEY